MGKTFIAPLILLAAMLSSGCGYALAGRGAFLPDTIKTIFATCWTDGYLGAPRGASAISIFSPVTRSGLCSWKTILH